MTNVLELAVQARAGSRLLVRGNKHTIHCECGNHFDVSQAHDQRILSTNEFCRIGAIANHVQRGKIHVQPGSFEVIKFEKPFESICKVYFTPYGFPLDVKERWTEKGSMTVLTSVPPNSHPEEHFVEVSWAVYGLIGIDQLPTWKVLFCGGVTNAMNSLYKPALLDYAASFESFLAEHLKLHLTRLYGADLSGFLLKRLWRVEERLRELLNLVVGVTISLPSIRSYTNHGRNMCSNP